MTKGNPTDNEHLLAMYRFVVDRIADELTFVIYDLEDGKEVDVKTVLKSLCEEILDQGDTLDTSIQKYAESNGWNLYKKALHEEHSGDCTKMPWTCIKCLAEEFYNYPCSVNDEGES